MEKLVIRGGNPIQGTIRVSGAKNAILPLLAATILTEEESILYDVPNLRDVRVMKEILEDLGIVVREQRDHQGKLIFRVNPKNITTTAVNPNLTEKMRSSIFLMGALLGRFKEATITYPGGCLIGPRPINLHISSLEQLGAILTEEAGFIYARTDQLKGTEIHLDMPSVGATENIMMAAVLAKGRTVVHNAAKEPEIVDLQSFLNKMGARVEGAGTDTLRIQGVSKLYGAEHRVMPDRIEAGTFMVAVTMTGGKLSLENICSYHMEAIIAKLRKAGAKIKRQGDLLTVEMNERPKAIDVKTMPYPGFPTDMQNQMMALACVAEGTSVITENVFDNRFKVADEFRRMGAQIQTDGRIAIIRGAKRLSGATVRASDDLRGGAALVLAGLVAEGVTSVLGVEHIDRGYERLEEKLRVLGVEIERLSWD